MVVDLLIRHNDQKPLSSILVRLQLVVGAVDACAAGEEEEQFGGRVGIVGGFGDVDVDVVEFCDFLLLFSKLYSCWGYGGQGKRTPVGVWPAAAARSVLVFCACGRSRRRRRTDRSISHAMFLQTIQLNDPHPSRSVYRLTPRLADP